MQVECAAGSRPPGRIRTAESIDFQSDGDCQMANGNPRVQPVPVLEEETLLG